MRSLRTRLALIVFVTVFGAVLIVGLGVLRGLEGRLRDEGLHNLQRQSLQYSRAIDHAIDPGATQGRIDILVRAAADQTAARVTLLGVYRTPGEVQTYIKSDSTREVEIRDLQFDVAVQAARTGRPQTATEAGDQGRGGGAAPPPLSPHPDR